MQKKFHIKTTAEANRCIGVVKKIAMHFGFSLHESELLAIAISEAVTNSIRYADGAFVKVSLSKNKKGIIVTVEDSGKGISNLKEAMQENYTSRENSLGLGFSTIKNSVDEFHILKNDATGFIIRLEKYLNIPEYDIAEVSIKKEAESFNGDTCLVKHYRGDCTLFGVIDGAGSGFKAYKSSEFIKLLILENYTLALDDLLRLCHKKLLSSNLSRAVELVLVRITPNGLEYIILGNTFIKSFPSHPFQSQSASLGLSLPETLKVTHIDLEKHFCLSLCSDGIDNSFKLYNFYGDISAQELATEIFNNYNIDDDSSIIVIKR